jgi:aspartate kinase
MIVVKFGGSSLAGPERMLAAARIVAGHAEREPVVCVVSAMAGVTNQLLAIAEHAAVGAGDWRAPLSEIRQAHEGTLAALATADGHKMLSSLASLWDALEAEAEDLAAVPAGLLCEQAVAAFSAWGERLSVRLFAASLARVGLNPSCFEDAPVIVERSAASVSATRAWLCEPIAYLLRCGQTPVLPGYLAMTQDGEYTTLGRNGSDHSAAVIAAALGAAAVYLYSDVAGVYESDPRITPQARLLTTLSYDEAAAIAARGARVLHPATIPPLAERGIPLRLRSALAPAAPGTDIGPGCTRSMPPHLAQPPIYALLAGLAASASAGKAVRPDAF